MQKNPVGWFELPVSDMDRAERFYSDFFGYEMSRKPEQGGVTMSWFPADMEGYGATGSLVHGETYVPTSEGVVVYFTAPGGTVEAALVKAKEQGIRILTELTPIGEYGFVATILDSEGNRIAIHSREG